MIQAYHCIWRCCTCAGFSGLSCWCSSSRRSIWLPSFGSRPPSRRGLAWQTLMPSEIQAAFLCVCACANTYDILWYPVISRDILWYPMIYTWIIRNIYIYRERERGTHRYCTHYIYIWYIIYVYSYFYINVSRLALPFLVLAGRWCTCRSHRWCSPEVRP